MAGLDDGLCPSCQGTVYSQAHIIYECSLLQSYRTEHLSSIRSLEPPAGPQRSLIQQFVHLALHRTPLDERVLVWTGMFNKMQRTSLQPFLGSLSLSLSRSLLEGTGRSFARATRTLWELFRSQVASSPSTSSLPVPCDALETSSMDFGDPAPTDWDPTPPLEQWQSTSSLRLREEVDYG